MKKVWLIVGAVVGCAAGGGILGACGGGTNSSGGLGGGGSSNASTSGNASTTGATTNSSSGGPTSSSSGGATTSSSNSGSSSSGICDTITKLHPPKTDAGPGTIFCPFSAVGDGGNEYCIPTTEHCCETAADAGVPSACHPTATQCGMSDVDWKCEDPKADCPSGQDCCAMGASIGLAADPANCGNFSHSFKGTACVAAGTCNGIQMCTSDGECPSGKKCTPFGKAGNQVGGCN